MNRKVLTVAALFLTAISAASAEQTVGLFVNEPGAYPGYTLFSPMLYTKTYLINNEGLMVHSWESEYEPGYMAYLSADGYLYRSIVVSSVPSIGNSGGGVEKLDWDGNVVWHFEYCTDKYSQHHDIGVLPNGNVLMIAWEYRDTNMLLEAGRNPSFTRPQGMLSDYIVEVEPVDESSGKIVWEWHIWDHLVQDFDSTKANYGEVSNHPGLVDINYSSLAGLDWSHVNSVAYNEEFDQIILSSRNFNEIWVIDHSTTTEEARRHNGGKYGKGGDILYRWGNPMAYNRGNSDDQQYFSQHDAQWIESGFPGAGNILVFNNGSDVRNYPSVDEIDPPVDKQGNYLGGLPYDPKEPIWTWSEPNPGNFFVSSLSGAQRMHNGNTLISYGPEGDFFEVTPEGDIVWHYINPVGQNGPVKQGDKISGNIVFKIRRYPLDYPAFEGKDLTPQGPIELPGIEETGPANRVKLEVSDIFTHSVNISYQLDMSGHVSIKLYNALGQEVRTLVDETKSSGSYEMTWNGTDNQGCLVNPGVYFCKLQTGKTTLSERIVLVK